MVGRSRRLLLLTPPTPPAKINKQAAAINHHDSGGIRREDQTYIPGCCALDRVKKPLEPPYEGPFPVLERTDKYFTLKVKGKNVTTSIDRLRPAYLLADSDNITAEHPTAARPIVSGALPSTSSQQNPDPPDVEKYTEFQGTGSAPDLPRTRSGRIIKKPGCSTPPTPPAKINKQAAAINHHDSGGIRREDQTTDPELKDKIITGDETWVYGYDPETKPQTAEWRGHDKHVLGSWTVQEGHDVGGLTGPVVGGKGAVAKAGHVKQFLRVVQAMITMVKFSFLSLAVGCCLAYERPIYREYSPSTGPAMAPSMGPAMAPSMGPAMAPSMGPAMHSSMSPAMPNSMGPAMAPSMSPAMAPAMAPAMKHQEAPKPFSTSLNAENGCNNHAHHNEETDANGHKRFHNFHKIVTNEPGVGAAGAANADVSVSPFPAGVQAQMDLPHAQPQLPIPMAQQQMADIPKSVDNYGYEQQAYAMPAAIPEPQIQAISAPISQPQMPALPAFNPQPQQPALPAFNPQPQQPALPAFNPLPQMPAIPALKPQPQMPAMPALNPQPQQPALPAFNPQPQQPALPAFNPQPQQPALPAFNPQPQQPALPAFNPQSQQPALPAFNHQPQQPPMPAFNPQPQMPAPISQQQLPIPMAQQQIAEIPKSVDNYGYGQQAQMKPAAIPEPQIESISAPEFQPQMPAMPAFNPLPQMPAMPAFNPQPQQPAMPAFNPQPQQPSMPAFNPQPQKPAMPVLSPQPQMPAIPAFNPQPQKPSMPAFNPQPQTQAMPAHNHQHQMPVHHAPIAQPQISAFPAPISQPQMPLPQAPAMKDYYYPQIPQAPAHQPQMEGASASISQPSLSAPIPAMQDFHQPKIISSPQISEIKPAEFPQASTTIMAPVHQPSMRQHQPHAAAPAAPKLY
ncbi:hypothetical protein LAZ67_3004297 [Cordylochernes scorpioides]|uniref:Uncharacterized protein n=1 Tax=Cordylochernes scorpioides TaxID=51811 RepID=A0ABY6KAI1_9ARAC|nr:hypothetical protein LAZ67_3004297 [Cordylochernes scorpioides]